MADSDIPTETIQRPGLIKRFLARLSPRNMKVSGGAKGIGIIVLLVFLAFYLIVVRWSNEPDLFDVQRAAEEQTARRNEDLVTGYVTTSTLIMVASKLLDKPGGYLSNDVLPPSVFMDNMPSWEHGVLVQVRDLTRVLRNDISRGQTQSKENLDLAKAEPQFSVDNKAWLFPAAETEYRKGIEALKNYLAGVADTTNTGTQFYSRADNLRDWLKVVANRLGSLSQRLSASVGQIRINTDLAGDAEAQQSTQPNFEVGIKTPWLEIDDVFYEARGTAWALIQFLRAVEIDFKEVLEKKNALRSVQQIIRELEATQRTIWSPMVLNGSDFGFTANYSLVMSSYISRANSGIIDLNNLLSQG